MVGEALRVSRPQLLSVDLHDLRRLRIAQRRAPAQVRFEKPRLDGMDTEHFKEWFQAFAQAAGLTLHVEVMYGENSHHMIEACYKGLARALRQAIEPDPRMAGEVPSTKGVLGGSLEA